MLDTEFKSHHAQGYGGADNLSGAMGVQFQGDAFHMPIYGAGRSEQLDVGNLAASVSLCQVLQGVGFLPGQRATVSDDGA